MTDETPKVLYRMDNGTTYTAPLPASWGLDHEKIIRGSETALAQNEPITVQCEGIGWVTPNPSHIVAIEFVGGWEAQS